MAPEQWVRSKTVGPPADVYALGVLWFQLLAGRLPFIARAEKDLMFHHVMEPPPLELLRQLPEAMRPLLARMLDKKAPQRPKLRKSRSRLGRRPGPMESLKKSTGPRWIFPPPGIFSVDTQKGADMWSVREALNEFIQVAGADGSSGREVTAQHTMVREYLRKQLGAKTDFLSGSYSRNTVHPPLA